MKDIHKGRFVRLGKEAAKLRVHIRSAIPHLHAPGVQIGELEGGAEWSGPAEFCRALPTCLLALSERDAPQFIVAAGGDVEWVTMRAAHRARILNEN